MSVIEEAVKKIEEIIHDTGCDDGAVVLRRCTCGTPCQFERGVCIEACYGGSTGEFTTFDPVEATTKISFMFGAPLTTPKMKSAACAILNVLTSFLCVARDVRACPEPSHAPCLQEMRQKLGPKRIYCVGNIPVLVREFSPLLVDDPQAADVILITGEGLLDDTVSEIVHMYKGKKRILCIGPSTSGVAALERLDRFCPFGT
jgi:hypothetical protein